MKKHRGHTLLELMVVIGVMAFILANFSYFVVQLVYKNRDQNTRLIALQKRERLASQLAYDIRASKEAFFQVGDQRGFLFEVNDNHYILYNFSNEKRNVLYRHEYIGEQPPRTTHFYNKVQDLQMAFVAQYPRLIECEFTIDSQKQKLKALMRSAR